MRGTRTSVLLAGVAAVPGVALGSCAERPTEGACYFDDSENADKYVPPMAWKDWCDYPDDPIRVPPFVEENCPAGECIDTFFTCDQVSVDQECQRCPADDLDDKVRAAFDAHEREDPVCTDGSARDIIDFERGCMLESPPFTPPDGKKNCCYAGIFAVEPCGS